MDRGRSLGGDGQLITLEIDPQCARVARKNFARAGFADNVVRNGAVVDARTGDPNIQGIRRFYELVASEPRVNATAIQTVGSKGYDGFALIRVLQAP